MLGLAVAGVLAARRPLAGPGGDPDIIGYEPSAGHQEMLE